MDSMVLSRDETVGSNVRLVAGTYNTKSYTMHVKGDLTAEGVREIRVEDGALHVNGDATCGLTDKLYVVNGREEEEKNLTVGGDLEIKSGELYLIQYAKIKIKKGLKLTGTGKVGMHSYTTKLPELTVAGDYTIQTQEASLYQVGTITVEGDLKQAANAGVNSFNASNINIIMKEILFNSGQEMLIISSELKNKVLYITVVAK